MTNGWKNHENAKEENTAPTVVSIMTCCGLTFWAFICIGIFTLYLHFFG